MVHQPYPVPPAEFFDNWREFPRLVEHQQRLGRIGLKDPWIRNFVWLHDKNMPVYTIPGISKHWWKVYKPGFKPAIILTAAVIACEEAYLYLRYGYTTWNRPHH